MNSRHHRRARAAKSLSVAVAIEALELRRLLSVGSQAGDLDATFSGGDGYVNPDIFIDKLAVLPDGRVLVASSVGSRGVASDNDVWVLRLNADGTRDTTFGSSGPDPFYNIAGSARIPAKNAAGEHTTGGFFVDMKLAPGGKIAIFGSTAEGHWYVARLNGDGSLDNSFGGGDGVAAVAMNFVDSHPAEMIVQSDGKIVVSGAPAQRTFALARFNANGTLDTSFDGDGRAIKYLDFRGGLTDIAITSDGTKLIAGGMTRTASAAAPTRTLMRFNLADGKLDATFDGDGIKPGLGNETLQELAVQGDGKILVASNNATQLIVDRYSGSGVPDSGFGSGGRAAVDSGNTDLRQLLLQGDGRILLGGSGDDEHLALTRLTSGGTLDVSFGVNGQTREVVNIGGFRWPVTMALAPNNKLVTSLSPAYVARVLLADGPPLASGNPRILPDGTLAVSGTSGNDAINIGGSATQLQVTLNGVTSTFNHGTFNKVFVKAYDGHDNIYFNHPQANVPYIVDPGSGSDGVVTEDVPVSVVGGFGSDIVVLVGNGTLSGYAGGGQNVLDVNSSNLSSFDLNQYPDIHTVRGAHGVVIGNFHDNLIQGSESAGFADFRGMDGNDTIVGTNANDKLSGGDGDDSISGFLGNDTLDGGAGADTLDGGEGNDTAVSPTAEDTLISIENTGSGGGGGGGDANVFIDSGVLTIKGTSSADTITVNPSAGGNVTVTRNGATHTFALSAFTSILANADAGNDRVTINNAITKPAKLIGGAGNDSLVGGGGSDTLDGQAGADTMKGGSGNDTIDYSARTAAVVVGLGTLNDDGETGEKDLAYFDVETVLGGSGNDVISGKATDNVNNLFVGNGGNDSLSGGGGNDTLRGSGGNDTVDGGAGSDHLQGDTGNDVHRGGDGNDRLFGGTGDDRLFGDAGDDLLYGQNNADTLDGGSGNDRGFDDGQDTLTSIETVLT